MSVRTEPTSAGYISTNDLSAKQYYAVKLDTSNADSIVLAGAGEEAIGVLQNKPEAGEHADVVVAGGTKMIIIDGTIAIDAKIKSDAAGKGTIASTINDYYFARAIEAGTGANDIVECVIERGHIPT